MDFLTEHQDNLWRRYQTDRVEVQRGSAPRLTFLSGKLKSGERILNVGIGNGLFEELAQKRGAIVYAVDPIEEAVLLLRDRLSLGELAKKGYVEDLPFESGLFDVVVMSEVIEHLPTITLDAALGEVSRVLRIGGRFLGTVPARERLKDNLIFCPHCHAEFHRWGHHQSFTKQEISAKLQQRFAVSEIEEKLFISPWGGSVLNCLEVAAKKTLLKFGYPIGGATIYFAAQKLQAED